MAGGRLSGQSMGRLLTVGVTPNIGSETIPRSISPMRLWGFRPGLCNPHVARYWSTRSRGRHGA
jgi:hypothetical protein